MNLHAQYINLSHRVDRQAHMQEELARIGLQAIRREGINTKGISWRRNPFMTMYNRTPGAIGCMLSQILVMEEAYLLGKNALVMEDDLIFCDDLFERIAIFEGWAKEWDVLWLGGTVHYPDPYWHTKHHREMPECGCKLNRDAEPTDHPNIFRSYGSFSTHCYIINHKSIPGVISKLNETMHSTIGIDYSFIQMAPHMNNFVFLPGCVIQKNNQSDIGSGWTMFSGFSKLGNHWFKKEKL